jgi:hypothetical protein
MPDHHEYSLADKSLRSHNGSGWTAIKAIAGTASSLTRTLLERISPNRIRERRRAEHLAGLRKLFDAAQFHPKSKR